MGKQGKLDVKTVDFSGKRERARGALYILVVHH